MATAAPVEHQISASGGIEVVGRPKSPPLILALGGKDLRVIWAEDHAQAPVPVKVHRTTAARRVLIEDGQATASEHGLAWTWAPPATRSTVRYQIVLENRPDHPVTLEVRDPEWSRGIIAKLASMEWQAQGLTPAETGALTNIGLPAISRNSPAARDPARLSAKSNQVGNPVRIVTWDEENPDLVVWRPGPAAGEVEIRAPRWWISPEALATDHGLIRFLDLFSEPPVNP